MPILMNLSDVDPELDSLLERCIKVLLEEYIMDPPTILAVGVGLVAYALSRRFQEEGLDASESLRLKALEMLEDVEQVSLVP